MKKVLTVVFIFFIAFGLYSQTIDTSLLDLSAAKVSIAGPQSVYIRSIYYNGQELSILLKYNGNNGATVYGPFYEKDKLIQDSYNLDYTQLKLSGQNEILVSGIVIGNRSYSGVLKWAGGSTLVVDRYWKSKMPETNGMRLAKLSKKMLDLKDRYERQVADMKNQIAALKSAQVTTGTAAASARKTILSGFSNGKPLFGKWQTSYNLAIQTDTTLKFAKYSIPVYQNQNLISYSFSGKVDGNSGWVGYGLHFLVSQEKTGRGYGFGRSYLIWLTRDPVHLQNEGTYVELYESYNDVKMIPLARVRIPESINSTLKTEVLYSRPEGRVTISVNGKNVLLYNLNSPINTGYKIALRSLGGHVSFKDLNVKAQ